MSTTNDSGWNTDPLKNPKRKMESVLPAPTPINNLKIAAAAAVKLPQTDSGPAKVPQTDSGPSLGERLKLSGAKINSVLTSETAQGIYSGIGAATDIATQFIDQDTTKNPTGFSSQQSVGDALLKSGNPYAMAAGAAYKALSGIAEATGGNINTITKDQAKDIGINKWERFGNNVLGVIPGLGWGVQETSKGQKSHLIDEMSNAYADSVSDINQAQTLGGSKFLFGRNKIEDSIQQANWRNKQLTEINLTNTMRKKSDYAQDLAQQNLNRYMGTNYMDMRMGKQGMKFPELDDIREMLKNRVFSEENIQKFADGGSILPTGKLHKELSHINELGEQYEDLTRKGIPVVTLDENNEIQQVAEIEHSEICLSKEVTDQLEALWKIGDENAMIQAGKLITNELLYNTKDENNVIWGDEKQKKNS